MANKKQKTKKEIAFHVEFLKQLLTLATAAFGLVAALAWNSFIQELVNQYVKRFIPQGKLVSLGIYALIVTFLAVVVTWQLTKIIKRLDDEE